MRRLSPVLAGLLAATAPLAAPAHAAEVVYAVDRIQTEPPISGTVDCVAAGAAPGRVVVTGVGTSWGVDAASAVCRLYQGDRYLGAVSATAPGSPAVVAGPGTFEVGPGPVTVSASFS